MTSRSATSTGVEATADPARRERYGPPDLATGSSARWRSSAALLLLFGLVTVAADDVQGDAVRIMYVHVPSAWLAYLSFFVTAARARCSTSCQAHRSLTLGPRRRRLGRDRRPVHRARAGDRLDLGRLTWGVFWTWDARLTTHRAAVPALPRLPGPAPAAGHARGAGQACRHRRPHRLPRRADRALQRGVVARRCTRRPRVRARPRTPQIDGAMLFTLFVGVVAFTLVYVWLMLHRNRVAMMEDARSRTAASTRPSPSATPRPTRRRSERRHGARSLA